jgi:hypothetical protein
MNGLTEIWVPIATAVGAGAAAFFAGRRVERKRNNLGNPGPPANCPFANEAMETKMDGVLRDLASIRDRTGETLSVVKVLRDRMPRGGGG